MLGNSVQLQTQKVNITATNDSSITQIFHTFEKLFILSRKNMIENSNPITLVIQVDLKVKKAKILKLLHPLQQPLIY